MASSNMLEDDIQPRPLPPLPPDTSNTATALANSSTESSSLPQPASSSKQPAQVSSVPSGLPESHGMQRDAFAAGHARAASSSANTGPVVLLDTRQAPAVDAGAQPRMSLGALLAKTHVSSESASAAQLNGGGVYGEAPPSPTVMTPSPDVSVVRISETSPTTPLTTAQMPSQGSSPAAMQSSSLPPASAASTTSSAINYTSTPLTVTTIDPATTTAKAQAAAAQPGEAAIAPRDPSRPVEPVPVTGASAASPATIMMIVPPTQSAQAQQPAAVPGATGVPQRVQAAPAAQPLGLEELIIPPAVAVPPPLPTEVALAALPAPPPPIDAAIVESLVHPPPPPFPFNRREYPVCSGPLDGAAPLTGKYSYRYGSGWYYVGNFRDSLRRGEGELYYSNGGDGYVLQPPDDYDVMAPTYNRYIAEGHADMRAMELQKHYPEAFGPAGPRPVFTKSSTCEYPGCGGLLFYRPRHHCRQCGRNFCAQHGKFATTLPRLYYPKDAPQKVCQSCYENDKLISKTVTGDIYTGSFKFNYNWGRGTYIIQTKRERYEGDFDEGRMEGRGSYLFSNGDIYTGEYRNDKRDGRGTLQYRLNGLQQLQQDREELLSFERRKQQAPGDRDEAAAAVEAVTASLSLAGSYPQQKGEALYAGSWANQLPEGVGIFVTSALFYVGDFAAGERTGRASIVIKSTAERYDGAVRSGIREGEGLMTSPWGLYDGQWHDNQRSGQGRWEYRRKAVPSWDGRTDASSTGYLNVYSGQWVSDAATGTGRHAYWDGSHYHGQHLNLLPHGRGVMTYANRDQFVGDWVKGMRAGRGKMVYSTALPAEPDSEREANEVKAAASRPIYVQYDGEWSADLPHGLGECLYPDGAVYSGTFSQGQATGPGKTRYANGDHYDGGHLGGVREGRGVYTYAASGNSYSGQWKQGRRYIPEYLDAAAGGTAVLDDKARWAVLAEHAYTNAQTGEVYCGESLYGDEGDWARNSDRSERTAAAATAASPLHPSTPDSPAFVRHGLGVLRAAPSNQVYSHWMGHWSHDLREGVGRLFLLSSDGAATALAAHIVEGVWAADQPPHTGHVQAVTADRARGYSFDGLLSASVLPIAAAVSAADVSTELEGRDIRTKSSLDLHIWAQRTLSRLSGAPGLPRAVSLLSTPSSAAFVHISIPLSSAFALCPSGVGSFHFPNGDLYYGQLVAGKAEGKGQSRYVYPKTTAAAAVSSHQVYTGLWHAGRRDGLGQLTYADGSSYSGYWKQGDRSGLGSFTATLPAGASSSLYEYEGEWAQDSPNGRGVLRCASFVYQGELLNGLMHGQGRIQWLNGDSYSGQWKRGRREGRGQFRSAEDHDFVGALWYGRYHGYGSSKYAVTIPLHPPQPASSNEPYALDTAAGAAVVTCSYIGDYYYGFKTGRGRLNVTVVDSGTQQLLEELDYTGGLQGDQFSGSGVFSVYKAPSTSSQYGRVLVSRYDGEWLQGKRHGTGQQYFSDGRIYTGEWVKDHPHGAGRMQYPLLRDHSGELERDALPQLEVADYTGAWAMGVWRGSGSLLYSNGDAYTGEIADNHRHGSGCLTLSNGDTAKGIWKDDKKDGRLVYTFYRPLLKGGKTLPAASFPPSSSSPSHYLYSVESHWKEDVLDGVVLFRFLPSTTAYLTAIHTKFVDGLLSHSHPFQVVYADQQVYQGQLIATTTESYQFDLYQLAEMAMLKSNPAVLSASTTAIPSFEDCVARLPIMSSLLAVFPVTGPFFPFHVFAVVFCHTRVSRHGVGLLRTSSGEEYVGQWRNNSRHGRGQQVFVSSAMSGGSAGSVALTSPTEEQSVYVGSWQDDLMHGRGSLYIESRQVKLTTMFARGKANTEIKGKGRLENYAEQSVYAGDLTNLTVLNGIGQLVYCDGSSYQGTFVNGFPEGLGRKIEADGSVHIGYYLHGMRYGKGMSVSAEGVVERGSWRLDKKEGMFTRERAGQPLLRVKYVDGVERWQGK